MTGSSTSHEKFKLGFSKQDSAEAWAKESEGIWKFEGPLSVSILVFWDRKDFRAKLGSHLPPKTDNVKEKLNVYFRQAKRKPNKEDQGD